MADISFLAHHDALQASLTAIRAGEAGTAWAVYAYDRGGLELRVACTGGGIGVAGCGLWGGSSKV